MRGASVRSRSVRGMSIPATPVAAPAPPSTPVRALKNKPPKAASSRERSRSHAYERDLYGELSSRLRDLYAKAGAPDLYNWRFRPPPGQRSSSPA